MNFVHSIHSLSRAALAGLLFAASGLAQAGFAQCTCVGSRAALRFLSG